MLYSREKPYNHLPFILSKIDVKIKSSKRCKNKKF